MRRQPATITFRRESGKLLISPPIEIVSRFYSKADSWGINLQDEHPTRAPDKAFHNPALCAVAIPGLPVNRGLCSNLAIGALRPRPPATSLSLCAAFSPARRSNFLGCPSQKATLRQTRQKSVFTRTQLTRRFNIFDLVLTLMRG
jgi:hypothetical protein